MKQKVLLFYFLLFVLFSDATHAQSLLPGQKLPDNIVDTDCFSGPPGTPFSFNKLAESPSTVRVCNYGLPLVGDIDNDGFVEIVAPAPAVPGAGSVITNQLHIFKFRNNGITLQQTINTPYFNLTAYSYSFAKVDGNDYAAIFLGTSFSNNTAAADRAKLIKYVYNPTTRLYEEFKAGGSNKRGTYSSYTNKEVAQPMIADFNGDGIPEIVMYDKVFNARTMELLVDGNLLQYANSAGNAAMGFGLGGHMNNIIPITESGSYMAVADMDNDGIPEVIGGNCVYKVNITNPNGTAGNTLSLWSKCDKTDSNGVIHNEAYDGTTAIADMDGDGYLDIVVIVRPNRNLANPGYGALYIWNPRTKKVINKNTLTNIPAFSFNGGYSGPSVPFIGDIDGDGIPEICYTGRLMMYAIEYDRTTQNLTTKWSRPTNDGSSATTMSLFDFNQDKSYELVYRDEQNLRIINGADGADLISPIPTQSATGSEYPVIADINQDGAAEIIVTGNDVVRVFSSNPAGAWGPARTVWNQFSYNVVNVNEDLTIPRVQFNPAGRFSGSDLSWGNADDVYPFNGYLMQQTLLGLNGLPIWKLLPLPEFANTPIFQYNPENDEMSVTVKVKNTGDGPFENPFYFTVYKNNVGDSPKRTFTYPGIIAAGATVEMTLTIPDFVRDWTTHHFITIKINDNGNGLDDQEVCDSSKDLYRYYGVTPTDQDVCLGKALTIDCNFTLPSGNDTHQWQSSTNNITWTDIPGATSSSYSPPDKERSRTYYRVIVTDGTETITSASSYLRVRSCMIPVNHNISVMGY